MSLGRVGERMPRRPNERQLKVDALKKRTSTVKKPINISDRIVSVEVPNSKEVELVDLNKSKSKNEKIKDKLKVQRFSSRITVRRKWTFNRRLATSSKNKLTQVFSPIFLIFLSVNTFLTFVGNQGWTPNDEYEELGISVRNNLIPVSVAYCVGFYLKDIQLAFSCALVSFAAIKSNEDVPMIVPSIIFSIIMFYFDKFVEVVFDSEIFQRRNIYAITSAKTVSALAVIFGSLIGVYELLSWCVPEIVIILSRGAHDLYEIWKPLIVILSEATIFLGLNSELNDEFHKIACVSDAGNFDDLSKLCSKEVHSDYFLLMQNIGSKLGCMVTASILADTRKIQVQSILSSLIYLLGGMSELFVPFVLTHPILFVTNTASQAITMILIRTVDIGSVSRLENLNIMDILESTNKHKGYTWMILTVSFVISIILSLASLKPSIFKCNVWNKKK